VGLVPKPHSDKLCLVQDLSHPRDDVYHPLPSLYLIVHLIHP
jgi:hypothetical protein